MEIKSVSPYCVLPLPRQVLLLSGLLPLLVAVHAQAVEFSFADNEISGSIDSTVSYGQLWRVQGQDKSNNDINTNDGNRNFDTGLVSEVFKITTDMEARYQNYGVFVRGTAFYDTQIMDKRNDYLSQNNPSQPSQNTPNDSSFTYENSSLRPGVVLKFSMPMCMAIGILVICPLAHALVSKCSTGVKACSIGGA